MLALKFVENLLTTADARLAPSAIYFLFLYAIKDEITKNTTAKAIRIPAVAETSPVVTFTFPIEKSSF